MTPSLDLAQIADFELNSVPSQVPVSLGDVIPLLMHAAATNRNWLNDFADDTMHIPQDLYEILIAYRELCCSSKAA